MDTSRYNRRCQLLFSILWIACLYTSVISAQIQINEVCPLNESTIQDDYNEYHDWIEIYNPTDQKINLSQFYISDDLNFRQKYQLPDVDIAAKEFMLIFASDRDIWTNYIHTNFRLKSNGEPVVLTNLAGELVDEIVFPRLQSDQSYGRQMNGDTWVYFDKPSPGISNAFASGYAFVGEPIVSKQSGFYYNSIQLELSSINGHEIRFTLDGSKVDTDDSLYTKPIQVDATSTLKARAFDAAGNGSTTLAQIYFFQEPSDLDIIHLTTDPANLYDWEKGIFVKGPDANPNYPYYGANFWKETEIPIQMEYFEDGKYLGKYKLGAKIHGGRASRSKPMQSIRLIADEDFGDEWITESFFDESQIKNYKKLVLRNGSGDYNYTHFRDAYLARYFARENLNLDLLQFKPVTVYINGAYFGLMNLREKIDEDYLVTHYPVEYGEIDLLEEEFFTIEGDFDQYNLDESYALEMDLAQDDVFEYIRNHFDLENITDYMICQMVINNTDWPRNNIKYWRPRTESGKWRYLLFDMDVSMGRHGWTQVYDNYLTEWIDTLPAASFFPLISSFWQNEAYKNEFITRYADLLNSTFRSDRWLKETQETKMEVEREMKRHFDKWAPEEFEGWEEVRIPKLFDFAEKREGYARQYLMEYFNLKEPIDIELNVVPPGAGVVQVNTISTDEFPWLGYYFEEIPVQLRSEAKAGFEFSHWESNQQFTSTEDPSIRYNYQSGAKLTAVFKGEHQTIEAHVYPNPVIDRFRVDLTCKQNGPASFQIYTIQGQMIMDLQIPFLYAGRRTVDVHFDTPSSGIYFLKIIQGTEEETLKISTFGHD